MYGDMMYCNTCGSVFKDTWHLHDTRTENMLITNCPKCLSMHTMNASSFIEKYEISLKHISEKVCSFSYTTLYKHLKLLYADFCLHRYDIEFDDIYLTKKEKENNRQKV